MNLSHIILKKDIQEAYIIALENVGIYSKKL